MVLLGGVVKFFRHKALEDVVADWRNYCEDITSAQDSILSLRKDIVLNTDKVRLMGVLGEVVLNQYVYHAMEHHDLEPVRLEDSDRYKIKRAGSPLLGVSIKDTQKNIEREYDGVVRMGDALVILESKVVRSVGNVWLPRKPRRKGRKKRLYQKRAEGPKETKLEKLGYRYDSVARLLSSTDGAQNIAFVYFIPYGAYQAAIKNSGLMQELIETHGVYFVPFWNEVGAFEQAASFIGSHAPHIRWVGKYRKKYPNLYK